MQILVFWDDKAAISSPFAAKNRHVIPYAVAESCLCFGIKESICPGLKPLFLIIG
jgi:hypothetical protein